jgi:hypothetical protein
VTKATKEKSFVSSFSIETVRIQVSVISVTSDSVVVTTEA